MFIGDFCGDQSVPASTFSHARGGDEKKTVSGQLCSDVAIVKDVTGASCWCTQSVHIVDSHDKDLPNWNMRQMTLCKGDQSTEGQQTPAMLTGTVTPSNTIHFFDSPALSSPLNLLSPGEDKSNDSMCLRQIHRSHFFGGAGGYLPAANMTEQAVSSPMNLTTAATTGASSAIFSLIAEGSSTRLSGGVEHLCCDPPRQCGNLAASMLEDKRFYGMWKVAGSRRGVAHLRHAVHKHALEVVQKNYGSHSVSN